MKWVRWFFYGVKASLVISAVIWLGNATWAYAVSEPIPRPIKILTGSIGIFVLYILFGVYGVIKYIIKKNDGRTTRT